MTTGLTASITLAFGGQSASAYGQEVDLAIDGNGDLLEIDPAGDKLIVTPGIMTFTGVSASSFGLETDLALDPGGDLLLIDPAGDRLIVSPGSLTFVGATAAFVVADRAVALQGEGWVGFETEGGQALESEGT
jgi:hypothetical protein